MKILSPKETVRAQCYECMGLARWDRKEVENCKGDTRKTGPCPLYPYRLGKRISVKVFRAFCKQCMGCNDSFIKNCPSVNCRLYSYRMGRSPARQDKGGNLFQTRLEPMKTGPKSFEIGQRISDLIKAETGQGISEVRGLA